MFPKHAARSTSRRTARRAIVLAGCVAGVLAPATAQAAPVVDVTPSLSGATRVAVGDVAQGQLTISNHSTAPEDAGYLTLSEITLVPSCGAELADRNCVLSPGADNGVITIADTATGSGACTGNAFAVAVADPSSGKVSFTPGSTVVLGTGPASSTCVVTFTYTVNHVTTKDSGSAPGSQTDMVAFTKSTASWNGFQAPDTGYVTVTVAKDAPELTARASPAVRVGGQLSVAGTIAGTHPDGTMTFSLFGPGDPGCTGPPMSTSQATVNGNGTYSSSSVAAAQAGTYRWKAAYAGDADNDVASSACNAPAAATVVSASSPPADTPGTNPGDGGTGDGATGNAAGVTGTTPGGSNALPIQRIRLDAFGLTRKTFARAATATALAASAAKVTKKAKKTAKGTTIKFKLSAPATVTIVVERVIKGRRAGAKCVKATKKLKSKKSCTRYVKSSTIKRVFKSAGAKKVAFSGRAGRRALAAGSYRMRAWAAAGAGTTSAIRTATFKIVSR